ncbi:MAG: low molecular weight protein-tyrosine-phosphatase [Phycisphaerales bacterium]
MSATGLPSPTSPDARGVRRVLFVCLGNICRSPLAQGVFEHLAQERGVRAEFTVASRGTGDWHVGRPPDPRAIAVAQRHGVRLNSTARLINPAADAADFELILGMDRRNVASLIAAGFPAERVGLYLGYLARRQPGTPSDVPDPYYGGDDDFLEAYRLIHAGAHALLEEMLREP